MKIESVDMGALMEVLYLDPGFDSTLHVLVKFWLSQIWVKGV